MQRTIGLCLGGGGGKGSAHIGVLHELERVGIQPNMVAGTSIGAIIGAVVAAGYNARTIEQAFRSTPLRRILSLDPASWGLIGSEKLAGVLSELLGDQLIEDLPIPYAAVAVDLVTGHEIVLQRGSLVEAALASAAVPGVFPPRRIDRYILADGGIRNNLPIDITRQLGAERVIAVNLIGEFDQFEVSSAAQSSLFSWRRWVPLTQLALAERAIGIMVHQITLQRLRETPPDLLFSPDVNRMSMADLLHLDDGIQAGIACVADYYEELQQLALWQRGELA
ncbi:patatin-like phospholipase family protein [Herpetosiphon sp. NSE202]|uniref:patatin-like phospholipase family protein n=1 Tax=Herpetosiphon sp. NSE202 TaxID=3351349 RepID=UPI003625EF06